MTDFSDECEKDWTYDIRRCPLCKGLVDDECLPPHCCSCSVKLPDGPGGLSALPAPSGRRLQLEIPDLELPLAPPQNVHSMMTCISCESREIVTDKGPHKVTYLFEGKTVERDEIEFPAFQCAKCGEGWIDYRGGDIKDAWLRQMNLKYHGRTD